MNCVYIHPLKQELVQRLQKDFADDENIKAVIVFGSGVEFRCDSFSDLDLYIVRYDSEKFFHYDAAVEKTLKAFLECAGVTE